MSTKKSFFGIAARGIAMGAADVVPGVSGGTIAFITGIYEELLETISKLNFGLFKTWKKDGFKAMWNQGNFSFLAALFTGIAISIISLAVFIEFLLEHYPIQLWSFFFGLILASVWLVGKSIKKWDVTKIIALILGSIAAFYITTISPTAGSESLFYIFICGSIAICAMILPGISGSFILLLLGAYTTVLGAVSNMVSALKISDWTTVGTSALLLSVFILGCLAGLISFSKLLNWLFKKAHDITIAILTGFLIGSLNKIWPWKETISSFIKHPGEANEEIVPLVQKNIAPSNYETLFNQSSYLLYGILLAIFGIFIIILLDKVGRRNKMTEQ
jgi:putative membrane protein